MTLSNMIVPLVISGILVYGLYKDVDVFDCFLLGAREGLQTAVNILPSLVALMTCVGMFKASGALDVITHYLSPAAGLVGIPREVIPLAVLRPISGSGALVLFTDILGTYGPDSFVGRVASVIEGSSETTFYTIAVYYGAVKIGGIRHTLPASLTADLVGFIMSAVMVRAVFGA